MIPISCELQQPIASFTTATHDEPMQEAQDTAGAGSPNKEWTLLITGLSNEKTSVVLDARTPLVTNTEYI